MNYNDYIVVINPSLQNTGFSLWDKYDENIWYPIWANNYNFEEYNWNIFKEKILKKIAMNCNKHEIIFTYDNFDLYIERGIFNPKLGGKNESLEHLRGFIAGRINNDIFNNKDKLIDRSEWQNWYKEKYINQLKNIFLNDNFKKWKKEYSIFLIDYLMSNVWKKKYVDWWKDNHNIVLSLLIGWYIINNKNSWNN